MYLKTIILFFVSIICADHCLAQDNSLKVNYEVRNDRSVQLNFEKDDPGTHTVVLTFSTLINSSGPDRRVLTASGRSGRLETLTPSNKDQNITFSYSYSYIRGKLKPRVNNDMVYLLPYKKGKKTKAYESSYVNAMYFGNTTPDDWKAYHFYTDAEDTVTAIRKGIVVDIKNMYETASPGEVAYKSSLNEMTIEHPDGTLATYRGFKKGSFMVEVGQTVLPGTALGINSKYSSTRGYNISLIIIYLKSADLEGSRNKTLATTKSLYGFVTPHFCTAQDPSLVLTSGQEYASADIPEIMKKELTKREIKLLGN
jgi:hypothetical protein